MSKINGEAYEPEDAESLHRATATVIQQVRGDRPFDKKMADDAAKAVLSVIRTGYARDPQRRIDADDLAEAAIARVRATVK